MNRNELQEACMVIRGEMSMNHLVVMYVYASLSLVSLTPIVIPIALRCVAPFFFLPFACRPSAAATPAADAFAPDERTRRAAVPALVLTSKSLCACVCVCVVTVYLRVCKRRVINQNKIKGGEEVKRTTRSKQAKQKGKGRKRQIKRGACVGKGWGREGSREERNTTQ